MKEVCIIHLKPCLTPTQIWARNIFPIFFHRDKTFEELVSLIQQFLEADTSESCSKNEANDAYREQLVKKYDLYFIMNKKETIGYCSVKYCFEDKHLHICHFFICSSKREKGCGTDAFKSLIKKFKPNTIKLSVNPNNLKAAKFWFNRGFEEHNELKINPSIGRVFRYIVPYRALGKKKIIDLSKIR